MSTCSDNIIYYIIIGYILMTSVMIGNMGSAGGINGH